MIVLREGRLIFMCIIIEQTMTNWIQRWEIGETGWHRPQVNARLIKFIDCLNLQAGDSVFVPLCGSSNDMAYLLLQGFKVIGVELSALAIERFFSEHSLSYTLTQTQHFQIYQGENITLYCGDYFLLDSKMLASASAVYDRAALIALPVDSRAKYVKHLYAIISSNCTQILLLTLNYPQSQMSGPPYTLGEDEIVSLYKAEFVSQQLECFDDIKNEPKFKRAGVTFIEKATYCLHRIGE